MGAAIAAMFVTAAVRWSAVPDGRTTRPSQVSAHPGDADLYLAFVFVLQNLAIGNEEFPGAEILVGAVGILFVVLGAVMPRIRPHWFAGIRTPWTLTSLRSWEKTHRLGGWCS